MALTTRLLALAAFLPALTWADFTYLQTARITGGSMVRMMKLIPGGGKALQPTTSTIAVKGNRMVNASDRTIHIIDLDKEIMTEVDLEKKEYSTITFAEFRQVLDAMAKKMNQQSEAEMNFKVDVKETGQTRRIQNLDTREYLMTLEMEFKDPKSGQTGKMVMDNDLWLAPDVAGYQEIRQFYLRLSEKLGWSPDTARMGPAGSMQPGLGQGMAKLMKEGSKLQGVPVLQVTKMQGPPGAEGAAQDSAGGGGAGPDVSDAARRESENTARNEAGYQAGRAAGGRFGGIAAATAAGAMGGIFGKKKPKEDPKQQSDATPAPQQTPPATAASSSLMEMTMESSGFSAASVDPAKFEIPAGLKQVEHPMKKAAR